MSNYDEFKKKAKGAFDTIADVSVEAYRLAEEKAKVLAKKAKLNAGIMNEKALIRRMHIELGSTYYKLYKEYPGDDFKQACEEISLAVERINVKMAELEDLKYSGETCGDDVEECCCTSEENAQNESDACAENNDSENRPEGE